MKVSTDAFRSLASSSSFLRITAISRNENKVADVLAKICLWHVTSVFLVRCRDGNLRFLTDFDS